MKEVGKVLHAAGSGRLIVQLTSDVGEGSVLCDRKGARIAKVMEIIGNVQRPYASSVTLTNNTRNISGRRLFVLDDSPSKMRQ